MLQHKLLGTSNPTPDQLSESARVYDTDISAPSDAAECPASFHSEAEMFPKNDCQFEIVLLVKLTELSDRECVKTA